MSDKLIEARWTGPAGADPAPGEIRLVTRGEAGESDYWTPVGRDEQRKAKAEAQDTTTEGTD